MSRRAWWCCAAAGALLGSAAACATGVDVSQAELAEICAEPDIDCEASLPGGSGGASGSGPVGVSGSSGSGNSGSGNSGSGGSTQNNTGGTGGGSSGTGGGSSGASGSAGSSSTPPLQPLARGTCLPSSSVVIVYTDRDNGAVMNNQSRMTLHVQNDGASFDLTDLTIRYWFTDDGVGDFIADIDYASQSGGQDIKSSITVTFGEESGSNYAQVGFSAGNPVGPEGVDQIQLRLHTSDYRPMDQSNDFSYQANAPGVANANVTPYVNGMQVGGCVPIPP